MQVTRFLEGRMNYSLIIFQKYGTGESIYVLSKTFAGKYEFLFTPFERTLVIFTALLEIHRYFPNDGLSYRTNLNSTPYSGVTFHRGFSANCA